MARKTKDDGDEPKTVIDMKRGKAADGFKVRVDGDGDGDRGRNWQASGESLDELGQLVDKMEDEIREIGAKKKAAAEPFNVKVKERRAKISEAKAKLVEGGYPAKALNTFLRQRKLRREAEQAVEELDDSQKRDHAALTKAWKDFASIPGGLGEAASRREAELQH